jgi:Cft2 family RNA processing exonuclease
LSANPQIRVTAISGVGGKFAACFLVETGTARFLLDLGEQGGRFPDLSNVGAVDAVLISHGHADHIGGLHLIDQIGMPPIYATTMTRTFAGHPQLIGARDLPLRGCLTIAGTSIETGRAGHAAGGIWMRIGGTGGVLYTGDICGESLLYPLDPLPRASTLITDASYGRYDDDLSGATGELIARAQRSPILLPLPPTGRGLEIAVLLHEAGLPVSLCAQHQHVARQLLAAESGTLAADGPKRLSAVLAASGTLNPNSLPAGVMIAANAGATGGTARTLFESFLERKDVAIVFTGHVENCTAARSAIGAGSADYLRWNVHPRFRDLAWIDEVVRPRRTIFAFCEAHEAETLRQALQTNL